MEVLLQVQNLITTYNLVAWLQDRITLLEEKVELEEEDLTTGLERLQICTQTATHLTVMTL